MKTLAKHLLRRFGLLARQIRGRGDSFVMMFHGVGGREMPREQFAALLDELSRIFDIRPLDALDAGAGPATGGRRPSLYLTFDDGLRNNHTIAYPLLRDRGLPAAFFLCPGLIDTGRWIWTHEVRSRLGSLDPAALAGLTKDLGSTAHSLESLVREMKASPLARRLAWEERIREHTARFAPTAAMHADYDLMSWDEAATLDPAIITIGSHSLTHQMLDSATDDEIEREIAGSRQLLTEKLGRPVDHFCYPDGRHSPAAITAVRAHYCSAVTTKAGPLTGARDPHILPRIGSDPDLAEALWRLARSPAASGVA